MRLRTLLAVMVAGLVWCSTAVAAGWPQFGFDAAHTSNQTAEHHLSRSTVPGLRFAWSVDVGDGTLASPVVGGGKLFAGLGGCAPCTPADVFAFTAARGRPLWSQVLPSGVGVFEDAYQQRGGLLWAGDAGVDLWTLRAGNGRLLGNLDVGGPVTVTVDGRTVYASGGTNVVAVRRSGGWSFSTAPETLAGPVAVFRGVVYASGDESVFALRASDGTLLWRTDLGRPLAPPAVDAHAVYVGGYRLTALDRHTGSSLWESELFGVSTPAVADRRLFVNAQDPEFGLSAVDERTGAVLWNNQVTGEAGDVPAVANGVVFEVAESGPLVAVDAADGTLLASETDPAGRPFDAGTGGNRIAQVAIAGGRVYVATAADGGPNGIDVFEARRR